MLSILRGAPSPLPQAFRPFARAAVRGITGPEGIRLTGTQLGSRRAARLANTRPRFTRADWSKRSIRLDKNRFPRDAGAMVP